MVKAGVEGVGDQLFHLPGLGEVVGLRHVEAVVDPDVEGMREQMFHLPG